MNPRLPLVLALIVAGAADASATVWSRAYDVTGRPRVVVTSDDFSIHVRTRPAGPVEIRVEYAPQVRGIQLGGGRGPSVEFRRDGDTIHVEVAEPGVTLVVGVHRSRSRVDITLPTAADLSVRGTDGSVTCDSLAGQVAIETGDGDITLHAVSGTIALRTRDGRIRAEAVAGRVRATSGDGGIELDGRFTALDARSGDGTITATVRPGSVLERAWELSSKDGALDVRIPPGLAALLDAHRRAGGLDVELPITPHGRIRDGRITGRLNGGGPLLRLRTGDGALRLGRVE